MIDPMDQFVSIAAAWDRCCGFYIERHGQHLAHASYLEWATENCERRPSTAKEEVAAMRKSDERRVRSTDGAFAMRLLYGWSRAHGDHSYKESDVATRLLPALGSPDMHPRTMIRLITALARFGLLEREVGVRSRETTVKISKHGCELYEDFCGHVSMSHTPVVANARIVSHV